MYRRFINNSLAVVLGNTRVVLLNGARQTGKSTIAQIIAKERNGQYRRFDRYAKAAATGFSVAYLYMGDTALPFGEQMCALPVSALWSANGL